MSPKDRGKLKSRFGGIFPPLAENGSSRGNAAYGTTKSAPRGYLVEVDKDRL